MLARTTVPRSALRFCSLTNIATTIFDRRCPVNPKLGAAAPYPPTRNLLLAALSAEDYRRLLPHLEPVRLPLGSPVCGSGDRMAHALFPTEGIVALLQVMENGVSAEIALTGNEGLIGISMLMGGGSTPSRAIRSE